MWIPWSTQNTLEPFWHQHPQSRVVESRLSSLPPSLLKPSLTLPQLFLSGTCDLPVMQEPNGPLHCGWVDIFRGSLGNSGFNLSDHTLLCFYKVWVYFWVFSPHGCEVAWLHTSFWRVGAAAEEFSCSHSQPFRSELDLCPGLSVSGGRRGAHTLTHTNTHTGSLRSELGDLFQPIAALDIFLKVCMSTFHVFVLDSFY